MHLGGPFNREMWTFFFFFVNLLEKYLVCRDSLKYLWTIDKRPEGISLILQLGPLDSMGDILLVLWHHIHINFNIKLCNLFAVVAAKANII